MKEYKTEYGHTVIEYEREDLEKLHTRKLIAILRSERYYDHEDGRGWVIVIEYGSNWMKVCEDSVVRDILKHRPHIPNKEERKKLINSTRKNTKKNLEYRK